MKTYAFAIDLPLPMGSGKKPAARRHPRPVSAMSPTPIDPRRPEPKKPESPSEKFYAKKIFGIPVLVIIGGLVVAGLAFMLAYKKTWEEPFVKYVKSYESIKVTRKSGEPFKVDFDILNPEKTSMYDTLVDQGRGLDIYFETDGKLEGLPYRALEAAADGNVGTDERGSEMILGQKKLREYIDSLNNPPRKWKKFILFADNTSNDRGLGERVTERYHTLGINAELAQGNGLKLKFHRITGTPFYQGTSPMQIVPNSPAGTGETDIKSRLVQVFSATEDRSAIATGMFNALTEDFAADPADTDTRILLCSDLMENDPNTVSFERGSKLYNLAALRAALADPEQRRALKNRLQAFKQCPKLNGAQVDIYLPPDAEKLPRMIALFSLWKEVFKDNNAGNVEMHY